LPSSVDKTAVAIGGNLALSKGSVVFKNEVLELIQYTPQTAQVRLRPLLVCPPQVNKFYAMDLSMEKICSSLSPNRCNCRELAQPHQGASRLSMSTASSNDAAVDATRQITGSPIFRFGVLFRWMTVAAYVGWLAANGQGDKVASDHRLCARFE
jgi:polyhydroxyalkanoate synthase